MLKGHVFTNQLFESQIFAAFIDTFTGGTNGILADYGNGMEISYNGSTITIADGCICIKGRFLEESTSTSIDAGTDSLYCKLVIQINLDEVNSTDEFLQGTYEIISGASAYPELTQTDIVKNNAGIYQYELARFQTSSNGISNFVDKRTYLDLNSIYTALKEDYNEVLNELKTELANVNQGTLADTIYPIGSIYMSVNSTNPTNLFGGTWEQIQDTFLLACGSNYEAGEEGGEEKHTLTISEMPSHPHTFTGSSVTTNSSGSHTHKLFANSNSTETNHTASNVQASVASWDENVNTDYYIRSTTGGAGILNSGTAGSHTHTVTAKGTISSAGGGGAHNNMPPYLAVYMWQRTA